MDTPTTRKDPVCGMDVNPVAARESRLAHEHGGTEYVFCGRGCMLDFRDDPSKFLDPNYVPSM